MGRIVEGVLRRQRATMIAALALLALLAWAWIASGAGMGMAARAQFALFPQRSPAMAMAMQWDLARAFLNLAMWWVMMVAMMVPAAAPVILLYAAVAARDERSQAHAGAFLGGYLLAWLGFSLVALALQIALEKSLLMTSMGMTLTTRWLAGGVLIGAGLYQFSGWKDACLAHCRNPGTFLARHYRPGAAGALRMGLVHGSYCVGCCWLLMALLFVGGVMNLAWIAMLTLIVAAEKLLPHGRLVARAGGVVFLGWGTAILLLG